MEPILDIKIEMNGNNVTLKGKNGEVTMIPFRGYVVKSTIFEGIVEPCGVDTQVLNAAKVRHMSARYMLTGQDTDGQEAHIYIENNGWFDEWNGHAEPEDDPYGGKRIFRTVPTFYTDSEVLADYLHNNQFYGEGHLFEDGLHILFFEVEDRD